MKVIIYSKKSCPNCVSAEEIVKNHNVDYEIKKIDEDPNLRDEYIDRAVNLTGSAPRVVPGIFAIDGDKETYIPNNTNLLDILKSRSKNAPWNEVDQ